MKLKKKIVESVIARKLNKMNYSSQYELMKRIEKVYLSTGKPLSEKRLQERKEALEYLESHGVILDDADREFLHGKI